MPDTILEFHPLLRIAGHDSTAEEALLDALAEGNLPIQSDMPPGKIHVTDPYQIDTSLQVFVESNTQADLPASGMTYAGLTPAQRGDFLLWAQDPTQPGPQTFLRLFVAHVEVGLLDPYHQQQMLQRELIGLASAPAWRMNEWHARVLLLALWLSSNGEGIAEWTSTTDLPQPILEIAIGLQMLLHEDLRIGQIARLASAWEITGADTPPHVLELRLRTTTESLGQPLLDVVRESLPEELLKPRPWRTAHRSLRFSLPQPVIRPYLQPLLTDMLELAVGEQPVANAAQEDDGPKQQDIDWQLVLEFGQSRSEFYAHVLELAQRMPGYVQILDEDRRLVHRISIRKREMRRFWRIWDYVQNWSTTHIYVNGEELEQWKVWPYSQYLH